MAIYTLQCQAGIGSKRTVHVDASSMDTACDYLNAFTDNVLRRWGHGSPSAPADASIDR
jgi:hypothetical protein